ncbi:hypothetical protein BaRGS_00029585 [Batillaria attramentaria]|uniref:Uncharacterized protein n=1 Tax=Batillaria attramentaria TaxID=370345 RepID=A0ABD0JWQ5_9CAEN
MRLCSNSAHASGLLNRHKSSAFGAVQQPENRDEVREKPGLRSPGRSPRNLIRRVQQTVKEGIALKNCWKVNECNDMTQCVCTASDKRLPANSEAVSC